LISANRNDDRIGNIERLGHELEKIDDVAFELILQIGFEVPSCFEPVGQIRHKRIVGADFERPEEGVAKSRNPSYMRIAVGFTKPNAGAKFAPTSLMQACRPSRC
jgi:hypothetical protein